MSAMAAPHRLRVGPARLGEINQVGPQLCVRERRCLIRERDDLPQRRARRREIFHGCGEAIQVRAAGTVSCNRLTKPSSAQKT